jgi:hypothetical protein
MLQAGEHSKKRLAVVNLCRFDVKLDSDNFDLSLHFFFLLPGI